MPDHIHLLLTPDDFITLEKAVQYIKGGYSFQRHAKTPIWQASFTEHRVKDHRDYHQHLEYVHENPVRKGLATKQDEYVFSSAFPGYKVDEVPI